MGYSAAHIGVITVSGLAVGAGLGILTGTALTSAVATSILFSGTLAVWYSVRALGETLKISERTVALITGCSLAIPTIIQFWTLTDVIFPATIAAFSSPLVTGLAISAFIIGAYAYMIFTGLLGALAFSSIGVAIHKRNDTMIMENALPSKLSLPKKCSLSLDFLLNTGFDMFGFWDTSTPTSRAEAAERKKKLDEGSARLDAYEKSIADLQREIEVFRKFLIERLEKSGWIIFFGKGRTPTENCFILLIQSMIAANKQILKESFFSKEDIQSLDPQAMLAINHLGIMLLLEKIKLTPDQEGLILTSDGSESLIREEKGLSIPLTVEDDQENLLPALIELKKNQKLTILKDQIIREICYQDSPATLLEESRSIMALAIRLTKIYQKYPDLAWKAAFTVPE